MGRQKDGPGRKGRKDDISWQSPWVVVPFVCVSCFLFRSVGSYHIYTHTHTRIFPSFLLLIDPGSISSYFTRDLFPTVAYTLFPATAIVCFLLDKWLRRPPTDQTQDQASAQTSKYRDMQRCISDIHLIIPELSERLIYL